MNEYANQTQGKESKPPYQIKEKILQKKCLLVLVVLPTIRLLIIYLN